MVLYAQYPSRPKRSGDSVTITILLGMNTHNLSQVTTVSEPDGAARSFSMLGMFVPERGCSE